MAVMKPVLGPLSSYASGIIVEEIIAMIPPAANALTFLSFKSLIKSFKKLYLKSGRQRKIIKKDNKYGHEWKMISRGKRVWG